MTFMHKLARRMAMLKDIAWGLPALVLVSCELPQRPPTGPNTQEPARVSISPRSAMIRINQTTSLSAQGLSATGTPVAATVSFRVRGRAGGQIVSTIDSAGRKVGHYRSAATIGLDTVIASLASGVADTAVVQVTPMPVTAVTLSPPAATVQLGGTASFVAALQDSLGIALTGRVVTWTSTTPSVAVVGGTGVATALTLGTTAIIAASEGVSDTALVTVTAIPVASIVVTPPTATVGVGQTTPFTATTRDAAGAVLTGRVIAWTSTNTAVATVASTGVARGVAAGSASIIATSEGKADTSVVTVIVIPVATVTVTPAAATVGIGATAPFTATTRDAAGAILTGRAIVWTSTNAAVAAVNAAGVVTGVAAGSASIIATSEGQADTAAVTVIVVPVASVTVTPATASVIVGATAAFTATTRDAGGAILTGRTIAWTSNDLGVATVSATGVATGVASGSASIIATSEGKADTSTVTVTAPPPPGAQPDPTLLPVASRQAPNATAYNALNVRAQAAGFSYDDPVTGVRIWKITSATLPAANSSAGHDYSDGGNEVSLGWGPNTNTHTILVMTSNGTYYLVDFTRGVGLSNYRILPNAAQPDRDLCFSFSNLPSQPRIAYVMSGNVLKRFNTETMQVENTGFFPRSVPNAFAWLHHDKNDVWFVGVLNGNSTAYAFNSQTGQFLTHDEPWSDEIRLDRDGRYGIMANGGDHVRFWDLSNNTFGPSQINANFWFAHNASLRSRWVTANADVGTPGVEERYEVSGGQVVKTRILNNSGGGLLHHSGNWVQSDAELGGDLNRQWSFVSGYGADNSQFLWRLGVGIQRADGSDQRLLLHHYSANPTYFATPWGKPSPDGKVVIFNSNMNGAGRYDLFVAEMPLR